MMSEEIKAGDDVVCVDNGDDDFDLTIGKNYSVISVHAHGVTVDNDQGVEQYYFLDRFKLATPEAPQLSAETLKTAVDSIYAEIGQVESQMKALSDQSLELKDKMTALETAHDEASAALSALGES